MWIKYMKCQCGRDRKRWGECEKTCLAQCVISQFSNWNLKLSFLSCKLCFSITRESIYNEYMYLSFLFFFFFACMHACWSFRFNNKQPKVLKTTTNITDCWKCKNFSIHKNSILNPNKYTLFTIISQHIAFELFVSIMCEIQTFF